MGYNNIMRRPTEDELKEFLQIDRKIHKKVKNLNRDNFQDLWINEKEYKKHIIKRKAEGVIDNEEDYIRKIQETFLKPDRIVWKKFTYEFKKNHRRYDRIYYRSDDIWVDVFFENGKLSTAFVLNKKFSDIIFKGDAKTFEILDIPIEKVK